MSMIGKKIEVFCDDMSIRYAVILDSYIGVRGLDSYGWTSRDGREIQYAVPSTYYLCKLILEDDIYNRDNLFSILPNEIKKIIE